MNVQLVINPLHFNLLFNNKNIRFNLEEIEFMEIKNKFNYISLNWLLFKFNSIFFTMYALLKN